jgi:hypothetical protein
MILEIVIQSVSGFIIGAVVGSLFDRSVQHMEKTEAFYEYQMTIKINGIQINPEPTVFDLGPTKKRW